MKTIRSHIVQHTHWDREWYFTKEDALVLSDQVFTEALNELEHNPKANFCLDGQTSIVDDYLGIHPEKLAVIQKFVQEGRLFIGPWYAQTDALLVDAESILHNLIIGISETKAKYGSPMMVGYLPDTFGFNANLPTLLQQVGIDNFMCWRGMNFETMVPSPYFIWHGLGEKKVYAMNFPHGYMMGVMTLEALEDIPKFVKGKLDVAVEQLSVEGMNQDILVPSGIDQKSMILEFDEVVGKINELSCFENSISDYPAFVELIRKKAGLPTYSGELRQPVYSRVHRSIGSVRTNMKLANFKLEQKIIKRIEPLLVIAKANGIEVGTGVLRRLWKKVLENQAHDSIGGCVSDNVMEDINQRIKEANEIADGIENIIMKRMADALDLQPNKVIVFNTTPSKYKGSRVVHVVSRTKKIAFEKSSYAIIEKEVYYPERKNAYRMVATGYEYFDEPAYYELDVKIEVEIPAMGYTVVKFEETQTEIEREQPIMGTEISNENYHLAFENGQLHLTADGKAYSDFLKLVDAANDGDTYDYSPLRGDKEISLPFDSAICFKESTQQSMVLQGKYLLPLDLPDRLSKEPKTQEVSYEVKLILGATETIEGEIRFHNTVNSHRLRLKLNVEEPTEQSIAQIQNGFSTNSSERVPENWQEKMVEKPVALEIFDKSITVETTNHYLTIFADGLKEYERSKKHLFITLFSTTGELGKPNLAWRPGRASGDTTNEGHIMMQTPLAQEIGEYSYSFAIFSGTGKLDQHLIAKKADTRLNQSISYQKQNLNLFIHRLDNKIWPMQRKTKIPAEYSLLELPEELIVSALYPSYFDSESYIIRLANPTSKKIDLPIEVLELGTVVNSIEEDQMNSTKILPFDYLSIKIREQV